MKEFNVETFDLTGGGGTILIEANAGTGKTYNIQHLYRRYVEELGYKPGEILVVTFTEAATSELRDRIRKVISERLENVQDEQKLKHLKRAALMFDEAAISTIHGFCQRALKDFAFESGLSFENELSTDAETLIDETVKDFIRSVQNPSEPLPVSLDNLCKHARICLKEPRPVVKDEVADVSLDDLKRIIRATPLPKRASKFSRALEALKDSLDDSDFLLRIENPDLVEGTAEKNAPDLVEAVQNWKEKRRIEFLRRLRAYLFDSRTGLAARKKKTFVIGFDDLLVNLRDVLGGDSESPLAKRLRQTYRVVLVDEFQDTDPIQYEIFRTAFARDGWKLYLIGDPKQAIYGFRGGDIYTYLKAKAAVPEEDRYTLTMNYRSDAKIIAAVNGLFDFADVFGEKEIPYQQSACAGKSKHELLLNGEPVEKPARLVWLSGDSDQPVAKGAFQPAFFAETVRQITTLLNDPGYRLRLREEPQTERRIEPADIAVFLNGNEECMQLKTLLGVCGVPAIIYKSGNVFASSAAADLACALTAVLNPWSTPRIKAFLLTPWYSYSDSDLAGMVEDGQWSERVERFRELRTLWRDRGILEMVSALMTESGMLENVGRMKSCERYLVNTRHILEILQAEERAGDLSPEKLLRVLRERIDESEEEKSEVYEERLESDSRAVKIMTVHKCKGLQFPVAICPGVTMKAFSPQKVVFDPELQQRVYPASRQTRELYQAPLLHEAMAEDTRKLYVTFTRAENLCVVIAGNVSFGRGGTAETAFNRLGKIRRSDFNPDNFSSAGSDQPFDDVFQVEVKTLERMSEDPIAAYVPEKTVDELIPPSGQPEVRNGFAIMSYSSLATHSYENPEQPDDAVGVTYSEDCLPAGAETGLCLHRIFEELDFGRPVAEQTKIVLRALKQFGISPDGGRIERVLELVQRTLSIPLEDRFALDSLAGGDLRREWKFFFPVRGVVDFEPFVSAGLRFGNEHDRRTGFMTGSVDLLFRKDGRYYFADWKSDSLPDYSAAGLSDKMVRTGYLFQAMVYSVAMYRHLRKCIADFDFGRHFGGGYYLFVRGLDAGKGVYRFRPAESEILRFAQALGGEDPK